jgi:hypothetical protein
MPTYESYCHQCGKEHEYIRTVANYKDTPICCGVKTSKEIRTRPVGYMQGDLAYKCPVSDQVVTNWKQRKEIEAKHEITVVEKGMFKKKRKKEKAPELPDEIKGHLQPALQELAKQI